MEDLNRGVVGLMLVVMVAWSQPVAASAPAEFLQVAPLVADAFTAQLARTPSEQTVRPRRPAILLPLYVVFGVLQVGDARSSYLGVRQGLVELNPLMGGAVRSPGQLFAMKVATTSATLGATELLWRRHRKAAVVLMIVSNAAYGAIVANNVRMLR
jgi:uncharacterized protein DUF5658